MLIAPFQYLYNVKPMLIKILLTCFLFINCFVLWSQEMDLIGNVVDLKDIPVEYATVSLLSCLDSSLIKGTVTDSAGYFKLEKVAKDRPYLVKISHLGYKSLVLSCSSSTLSSCIRIKLEPLTVDIGEVIVKGQFIEQKFDRYIVRLKGNSLAKAKNAIEILAFMPGITELDGILTINGNSVSEVYLDNRLLESSDELKNLPATQIDHIEIVPEIRLRHGGTVKGGAIYITLKKLADGGGYGSVKTDFTVRKANFNEEVLGIPFSYRHGKLNLYNNLSMFRYRAPYETEVMNRNNLSSVFANGRVSERSKKKYIQNVISLVWDLENEQSLGVNVTLNKSKLNGYTRSVTMSMKDTLQEINLSNNRNCTDQFKYQISLIHDYNLSDNIAHIHTVADFLRQTEDTKEEIVGREEEQNFFKDRINLLRFKNDVSFKINDKMDLHSGMDGYYNHVSNKNLYQNKELSEWVVDPNRSTVFTYEGIGAGGYLDYVWRWKRFTLDGNLRIQGDWVNNDYRSERIRRRYFNLFPAAKISYALDKDRGNRLTFSYLRSMDDIPYRMMNPAMVYKSELFYEKGNPQLNPAVENRFSLLFTMLHVWNFRYSYIVEKDDIYSVLFGYPDNALITYEMPTNVGKSYRHSFFVGYSKRLFKWYYLNYALSASQNREVGPDFTNRTFRMLLLCQNNLEFTKSSGANCFLMYEKSYRVVETTYHSVYNIVFRFYKNLLKDKLTLGLHIYNIFCKNRILTTNTNNGVYHVVEKNVTPYKGIQFSVTYNFDFGNQVKVKKANTIQSVQDNSLGK